MDLTERQRAFSAQRINGPAQLPPPLVGDGDPTHLDLHRKPKSPLPPSPSPPPPSIQTPTPHRRIHIAAAPPVRTPEHRLALPPCLGSRYPKPYTIASWARSVVEEHWGRERGSHQPSRPPPASTTPPRRLQNGHLKSHLTPFVSTRPLTSPMPSAKSMYYRLFCGVSEYCHLLLYQSQRNLAASCLFFLLYKAYAPPPTSLPICSCPVE